VVPDGRGLDPGCGWIGSNRDGVTNRIARLHPIGSNRNCIVNGSGRGQVQPWLSRLNPAALGSNPHQDIFFILSDWVQILVWRNG